MAPWLWQYLSFYLTIGVLPNIVKYMLNYCRVLIFACLAGGAASAQSQFEVASIRPVTPEEARLNMGMHVDGALVRFNFLSVRDCMRIAYEVKNYQLIGPEWIASDRFNITAKLPAGEPG